MKKANKKQVNNQQVNNNGFHSDQNLNHPVFENISGSIEVEKQQRKQ